MPLNQLHNYRRDIQNHWIDYARRTAGGVYNTKIKRDAAKAVIGAAATYGWYKGKPMYPTVEKKNFNPRSYGTSTPAGTVTKSKTTFSNRRPKGPAKRKCRISSKYECCRCKSRYFRKIKY